MMVMCVLATGANAAAADLSLREFNVYVSRGETRCSVRLSSNGSLARLEWRGGSPTRPSAPRSVITTSGRPAVGSAIRSEIPDDSVRGYSSFFFVRHHWRDNARNVQPFVELGTGPMWSNRRLPAATSRFNMDSQLGVGAMLFRGSRVPMLVGYRLSHISNGGAARRNPGLAVHSLMRGARLIDFRRGGTP